MLNFFQVFDQSGNSWSFPEHAITGVKVYEENGGYKIEIYLSCDGCKVAFDFVKTKIEAEQYVKQIFNMNQAKKL